MSHLVFTSRRKRAHRRNGLAAEADYSTAQFERRAAADDSWQTTRTVPGAALPAGVRAVNEFRLRTIARRRLELPAADVSIVVLFDGTVSVGEAAGARRAFTSLVHGPSTRAGSGGHGGALRGVEVLMAPWLAWQVFAEPVHEFADGVLSLSELLGCDWPRLEDALATAKGPEERLGILQAWLTFRRHAGPDVAPQVRGVWQALIRSQGRARIADLVQATGWSSRTLERRFAQQIGQPPKKMARILRLRHAIRALVGGMSPARVAAACGFHDQAHFSHEVKAMTDLTPAELLAARAVGECSGPPLDRLHNHVTSILLD